MKKKKAYITPEVRLLFVGTQEMVMNSKDPKIEDNTGGNLSGPSGAGETDQPDFGKFNSGSLWDYDY